MTARKQLRAVAIVGERPGLAHQPVDHVPIIDARGLARRPRMLEHPGAAAEDIDRRLGQLHGQCGADQARGHRVRRLLDVDHARPGHERGDFLGLGVASCRQRLEERALLGELHHPQRVRPATHLRDEGAILRLVREIGRATQDQMVFEPPLQVALGGLDIAVLVRLPGVYGARFHPQMFAECEVLFVEGTLFALAGDLVRGRGTLIRLQHRRRSAELPQRFLHAALQGQARLRAAGDRPLPVRKGEYRVRQQMRKRLPGDRDRKILLLHPRPIKLQALARLANLREIHLLRWAVQLAPQLHAPLKRAQRPACHRDPLPATPQQMLKERLRVQLRGRLQPGERPLPQSACQRIGPRAVLTLAAVLLALLRSRLLLQVTSRSLPVHPRLQGRVAHHAAVLSMFFHKSAILLFGDHVGALRKRPERYRLRRPMTYSESLDRDVEI